MAEPRAEDLVRQLCEKVVGGAPGSSGGSSAASKQRDALREIAAIGLKALIKEMQGAGAAGAAGAGATGAGSGPGVSPQLAASASAIIASRMLEGMAAHKVVAGSGGSMKWVFGLAGGGRGRRGRLCGSTVS